MAAGGGWGGGESCSKKELVRSVDTFIWQLGALFLGRAAHLIFFPRLQKKTVAGRLSAAESSYCFTEHRPFSLRLDKSAVLKFKLLTSVLFWKHNMVG